MMPQQKIDGFMIYTEKLPYLQSSSVYLIQRKNQEIGSYDNV